MIRRYFSAAAGAFPVACLYGVIRASGYEGGWVLPVSLVFGLFGAEIGWRLSERRLHRVDRKGEVAQANLKPFAPPGQPSSVQVQNQVSTTVQSVQGRNLILGSIRSVQGRNLVLGTVQVLSGSAAVITLLSPVSRADVILVTFPDKVTAIAPTVEYHDLRELVG